MKEFAVITTISSEGRNFKVVKNEGMYCAIEDKYITGGKLNRALNGAQMHAHRTVEGCVKNTIDSCKVDKLVSEGLDRLTATLVVVMGMSIEDAKEQIAKTYC